MNIGTKKPAGETSDLEQAYSIREGRMPTLGMSWLSLKVGWGRGDGYAGTVFGMLDSQTRGLGHGDAGTWGHGDAGTRGSGDSGKQDREAASSRSGTQDWGRREVRKERNHVFLRMNQRSLAFRGTV